MLFVFEVLIDGLILGAILVLLWFLFAYFYKDSDTRLTKIAMAKYKTIASSLNVTITNNYDLKAIGTVVDRTAGKIQVTFQWIPKKAGVAKLEPCTKTFNIKELCEPYETDCSDLTCNESDLNCIGR